MTTKYNVKFPMFSKVEVNGENCHPLYKFLKETGPLNENNTVKDITWNFGKFIVNRHGKVTHYFEPKVHPDEFKKILEEELLD